LWRRPVDALRFPLKTRFYRTEPDVEVLVQFQEPTAPRGDIILVHGLEGSGEAGYIRSMSQAGLDAGFVMHRFHMRTCGGTERLSATLYHSGLTGDLLAVLTEFERQRRTPAYLVGFSLGGNVVLKLAGELAADGPRLLAGVCAVSTPLDLAVCARRIGCPDNRLYERRFVRRMRRRVLATGRYKIQEVIGLRSIVEFDDRVTAPAFGFRGAAHYYTSQSAIHFLDRIRVPTLLIQAKDDTLVPFEIFERPEVRRNPLITLLATEHGGHLGFLARGSPRFWLDQAVIEWIAAREAHGAPGLRNAQGK